MTLSKGFQSQVNTQPAPAVVGDFCDTNPRYSVDAGPGGLIAGLSGVDVGKFAWAVPPVDGDGFSAAVNNFGTGPVTGFVHREQQGLIVLYLDESTLHVPSGFPVTLFSGGGFWVKNDGAAQAVPGQKAYANFADGKATFAAAGAPAGAVSTSWSIAAETASVTASIAGDVMTVTVVGSGTLYPGSALSGTNVATGTALGAQISGTAGGVGTYYVTVPEQTVASTTVSVTYGLLTLTTVSSGTFGVGDTLTGATAGVVAGTYITQFITGAGASGSTAAVNATQTSSSGTEGNLTGATNVETKWIAMSSGLPGELVKISSQPLG